MAAKLKIEKRGDEIKKKSSQPPEFFLEENHPMTISSTFSSY
jgi:hypothetical protein